MLWSTTSTRLAEDHANAQRLGDAIRAIDGLELRPEKVETNLVIYRVDPRLGTAAEFSARLKRHGVLIGAFGGQLMRAVTHLDVSDADIKRAGEVLREACAKRPARRRANRRRARFTRNATRQFEPARFDLGRHAARACDRTARRSPAPSTPPLS